MTITDTSPMTDLSRATEQKTAVRAEVLAARRLLDEWTAKAARASAEIVRVQDLSPETLADPGSATQLANELGAVQAEHRIAQRGIVAQDRAVLDAETAYVEACLAVARADADRLAVALAEHEAKTAKLLAALERHDGPYVPRSQFVSLVNQRSADTADWCEAPTRAGLAEKVQHAGKVIEILEAVLGGRNPRDVASQWMVFDVHALTAEGYMPGSLWGEGALVHVGRYLTRRQTLADD